MQLTKLKAVGFAAVVAALGLAGVPAQAAGSTVPIVDANGVDYDAACLANADITAPPPNAVASPGAGPCQDGSGVSLYDGSTEATDIRGVQLASNNSGQFIATCQLDQPIVPAGSTNRGAVDLPADVFTTASCKVMFQNASVQTNVPTNGRGGGCARARTMTAVFDQHGHWRDGFHFFVGFNQTWDGLQWIHSVQIGEYNPAPDGGFPFFEVGVNRGGGWSGGVNVSINGATVTITVGSIVLSGDPNCADGLFRTFFAGAGDLIRSVKGLSTADTASALPVTVPWSDTCIVFANVDCGADLTSVGGYTFFSDVTSGTSQGGLTGSNILGVSYTTGLVERNRGGATAAGQPGQATTSADGGTTPQPDPFDTLGEGLTCPTPTFGGLLPPSPLFTPNTPCHTDDDPNSRGVFLPEFWDTVYGFSF